MFLPIGDDLPKDQPLSLATTALVGLNVLVFAVTFGSGQPEAIFERFAFDPRHPGPVTWLASLFLHAGLLHLLGNMLFLWIAGRPLEHRFGPRRFLGLYFAGGLAASIAQALWSPLPTVGASGAIATLMGAYAVLFPDARVRVAYWIGLFWAGITDWAAGWLLAFWVGEQVLAFALAGPTSHVGHAAHLGGFVAGAAITLLLDRRFPRVVSKPREAQPARAVVAPRRDDARLEAVERASLRAAIERALRRGDRAETARQYSHAALVGMRPVLAPELHWQLALVLLDREEISLGTRALEDLVRAFPWTEEAVRARRALRRLEVAVD